MSALKFDTHEAGFVIACYIADLARWCSEDYDEQLDAALKLADDLGVRSRVDHELHDLGFVRP